MSGQVEGSETLERAMKQEKSSCSRRRSGANPRRVRRIRVSNETFEHPGDLGSTGPRPGGFRVAL